MNLVSMGMGFEPTATGLPERVWLTSVADIVCKRCGNGIAHVFDLPRTPVSAKLTPIVMWHLEEDLDAVAAAMGDAWVEAGLDVPEGWRGDALAGILLDRREPGRRLDFGLTVAGPVLLAAVCDFDAFCGMCRSRRRVRRAQALDAYANRGVVRV